jgi:hypothetical protein
MHPETAIPPQIQSKDIQSDDARKICSRICNKTYGMRMNKLLTALALGMAEIGFAMAAAASSDEAKAAYYATADQAAADYRDAHARCETLDATVQKVCIEEAKLAQTRAKGTAEAQYKNTPQARQKAATDIANAEYAVAKAKCESNEAGDKNVCIRRANALRMVAIAEAKAGKRIPQATTETLEQKHDALKKVDMEKCDGLTGSGKERCTANPNALNAN